MPVWAKAAVAAVLLIPTVTWLVDRQDRVSLQNRLAPVASEIAGRQVEVRCPGVFGRLLAPGDTAAGVVSVDAEGRVSDHTDLRTATCKELDALVDGGRERQLACAERSSSCGDDVQTLAWAIGTVAHESVHLRGILDEALTECYAMQYLAVAAQRLGATPQQARNLALLHWETSPGKKPDQYQVPAGCEDGGRFDARPADPVWP
jgi:hypothetical protein